MTVATEFKDLEVHDFDEGLAVPSDVPAGLNGVIKRSIDAVFATILFIFILPLLAIIALMIRSQGAGPVIFKQTRCGKGGKAFTCYKFRTMHIDAPQSLNDLLERDPVAAAQWEKSQKLQNDPRITKLGSFLRRSSLDELPQLINIIAGDMSIIGPRPVTFTELTRYGSKLPYYAAARPGVTGLWQVNGRNNLTYDQRIAFDAAYARDWSLLTDLKILLKTIPVVLLSDGAF